MLELWNANSLFLQTTSSFFIKLPAMWTAFATKAHTGAALNIEP
jgi:hypothetical protein